MTSPGEASDPQEGHPDPGGAPDPPRPDTEDPHGPGVADAVGQIRGPAADPLTEEDQDAHFREGRDERRNASVFDVRSKRGAVAPNGTAIYNEVNYLGASDEVQVQSGFFDERVVEQEMHTYQPGENDRDASAMLHDLNVLRLCADPGEGPRTTAIVLLAEMCAPGRIGVITVTGSGSLALLPGKFGFLRRFDGYLLVLNGRPLSATTLDVIRTEFSAAGAFLVVIDRSTRDQHDRYTVRHVPPPRLQVLAAHLRARLEDHRAECRPEDGSSCTVVPDDQVRAWLDNPEVGKQATVVAHMCDVVELARELAANVHTGEDVALLVRRWDQRLYRLARKLLDQEDEPGEEHLKLRKQAFRIAYVLFFDHTYADVFTVAEMLSLKILPRFEVRDSVPQYLITDGSLSKLIHPEMCAPEARTPNGNGDHPRRARIVDEKLVRTLLEVAWHEYDTFRDPLLAWLVVLLGHSGFRIQIRAAQIAGLLATFDFDHVYATLLRVWARGNVAHRSAAAFALEIAHSDDRLASRVKSQVLSWAHSPDWRLKDSAARAYGTAIGAENVDAAIGALEGLGWGTALVGRNSIAYSLAALFEIAPHRVAEKVADWAHSDSESLADHAVRTLLLIARFQGGEPGTEDWPTLLALTSDGKPRERLAGLWRRALGSRLARRAWECLRLWLHCADRDKHLADVLEPVVLAAMAGPLNRPALFYMRVWSSQHGTAEFIPRIHALLRQPPDQGDTLS
ncbi:hypothetical protein Aple_055270 [Acrocarpospora pleiomorpha]|uniref:Uncharacterized protein n=1 Tax=Acrocarpospora pleiomorpha TaxID=90975 RepID=A0A5M3XRL8_9ACTN|nr:hypothetical protein Aple_055270 [Acrocarpospora pleiomorpha]